MLLLIKKVRLKNVEDFLNDILTGKIENKYDAEKEYFKNIQSDEDSLKSQKYRKGDKPQRLVKFIDDTKYIVFGLLFPSEEEDMPELESEESAEQRQTGQGLKLLTQKQRIIRLPILLAQLKGGNNFEKLKNEIRQIAYSLYRSKF